MPMYHTLLKAFLFFFLHFFLLGKTTAQLPDGSVAPDFHVEDIDGNTHDLYAYLNEGKTVILEIGATWCSPCWAYNQAGTLNEVNQILGENGLENTITLFIEGEAENSIEQLQGITGNTGSPYADVTIGDWTEAIHYPIIDNASIADLYEIEYYPTIFKICPNDKILTQLNQATVNPILDKILQSDCISPQEVNDLAILRYTGTETLCDNTELYLPIEIINLGAAPMSTASLIVENQTDVLATGELSSTLETFDRELIHLGPLSLKDESQLFFSLTCNADTNPHNNFLTNNIDFAKTGEGYNLTFDLVTDAYGYETYWEIRDLDGIVYASGGNLEVGIENGGWPYINSLTGEGAYYGAAHIVQTITLPHDGCYELVMVDDYGDGICCEYGQGSYKISDEFGQILVEGGRFSDYATHPFSIAGTTTNITDGFADKSDINVYPNPTSDYLSIESPPLVTEVQIVNTIGQVVAAHSLSKPNTQLDISELNAGIYFLNFYTKNSILQTLRLSIL